MNRQLKEAVQ